MIKNVKLLSLFLFLIVFAAISCSDNTGALRRPTRPSVSDTNDNVNKVDFPQPDLKATLAYWDDTMSTTGNFPYNKDISASTKYRLDSDTIKVYFKGHHEDPNYIETLLSDSSKIDYEAKFTVHRIDYANISDEDKEKIEATFKLLSKSKGDFLQFKTSSSLYDIVSKYIGQTSGIPYVNVVLKCEITIKSDKYKDFTFDVYNSYTIKQ